MNHLTPVERQERLARLILRGVYLYAQSQGWIDKNNNRMVKQLNRSDISSNVQGRKKAVMGLLDLS
ncbi:MAG: hypothetical protein A2218_10485 [Elusimicrobia bacterium RIFOXYA2_FULL_53_38]|nr:MAG: hypothetical protein A2218_10485 [Elusimicrobia bacterium RIFOXYA2_FULL_53_38]